MITMIQVREAPTEAKKTSQIWVDSVFFFFDQEKKFSNKHYSKKKGYIKET